MMKLTAYLILIMLCCSCAIHDKFPYICFYPQCVRQQFSLKPLKRNLQIALGNKRRSKTSSDKRNKDKAARTRQGDVDRAVQDSLLFTDSKGGFSRLDTVIRIDYRNLNDSVRKAYNKLIQSFVKRVGAARISEVILTNVYADQGTDEANACEIFQAYVTQAGVYKHKILRAHNKYIETEGNRHKPGKLLYLEIRFH